MKEYALLTGLSKIQELLFWANFSKTLKKSMAQPGKGWED